jgi:acid phosphatase type 7
MNIKRILMIALGVFAVSAAGSLGAPTPAVSATSDPVVAAAGDIACDPKPNGAMADSDDSSPNECHMAATAKLIEALHPAAVLTIGDEQYPNGALDLFMAGYDKTWGAFKAITHPAPGNHEYQTRGAAGYFAYFGPAAGDASKSYYGFDLGGWHLISLDGDCTQIGGCGAGSPEVRWLGADLTAHHAACTLAYWHQPRFSSGPHHSDPTYDAFWRALYAAHADLVLNGHDHDYERFAAQTPDATADPATGITEIVAGTGGRSHYKIGAIEPNSQVNNSATYGVLFITLHPHSFDWKFVPEQGATFTDSGSRRCHG